MEWVWGVIPWKFDSNESHDRQIAANDQAVDVSKDRAVAGDRGWGVEEAEERNTSIDASIWTQLALAYAIHKSFIFIRVPLTAAVTPKVVKVLRGWGWDIGKRKPKVPKPPPKE
ncbi:MAG: hypothetical protein M1837_001073 [Sclerophora amabilis]|nr:MAG: hypothetical protein M1837_001073 [Sclerophora amabilis]